MKLAQQELLSASPIGIAQKGTGPFSPRTFGSSLDISRASPTFARDLVENGQHFTIQGGDGVFRNLTQVPGKVNDQPGIFEFVTSPKSSIDGNFIALTHQRFIPNGLMTGFQNQNVEQIIASRILK